MTSELQAQAVRVLLVEDSQLLRERLVESLSEYPNIQVADIAISQSQAILLLQQNHYDMVIADIELAEGNGFEVIRFAKATHLHRPPVYIMLTNHAYGHYRKMARELGVQYFFDKSMDYEQAIDVIYASANLLSE